jgi:Type IV secretion system pilin
MRVPVVWSAAESHCARSSCKGASMSNPQSIIQLFDTLLEAATRVGLAAAALFLAWAGFLYMTAGGSPRRMESAKDAAFAAIGGLAVVLLAHAIAELVQNAIPGHP